jgi:uncharacterized protein Veg
MTKKKIKSSIFQKQKKKMGLRTNFTRKRKKLHNKNLRQPVSFFIFLLLKIGDPMLLLVFFLFFE